MGQEPRVQAPGLTRIRLRENLRPSNADHACAPGYCRHRALLGDALDRQPAGTAFVVRPGAGDGTEWPDADRRTWHHWPDAGRSRRRTTRLEDSGHEARAG